MQLQPEIVLLNRACALRTPYPSPQPYKPKEAEAEAEHESGGAPFGESVAGPLQHK